MIMTNDDINTRISELEAEISELQLWMQETPNVSPNVIAIKQRAVIEKTAEIKGLKQTLNNHKQ